MRQANRYPSVDHLHRAAKKRLPKFSYDYVDGGTGPEVGRNLNRSAIEAIKMAPVIHALRRRAGELETRLVLTGQHDELVDEVLRTFELVPDWDLEIMTAGQSPSHVGSACL